MRFEHQTALVTGGSTGIGNATVSRLLLAGARVALLGRNPDRLSNAVQRMPPELRANALLLEADVGSMQEMRQAFLILIDQFQKLDILINAAGINIRKGVIQTTEDDWDAVLRTNITGTFHACKLASELMIAQRGGVIVNVSSVQARLGGTSPQYSASKAAIHGLTFSLARQLAQFNIRVNAVAPGATDGGEMALLWSDDVRRQLADQALLKRLAQPDEIANAILFLASSDSSFITGTVLDVNGGAWVG